jgi:hypothetical protein
MAFPANAIAGRHAQAGIHAELPARATTTTQFFFGTERRAHPLSNVANLTRSKR